MLLLIFSNSQGAFIYPGPSPQRTAVVAFENRVAKA